MHQRRGASDHILAAALIAAATCAGVIPTSGANLSRNGCAIVAGRTGGTGGTNGSGVFPGVANQVSSSLLDHVGSPRGTLARSPVRMNILAFAVAWNAAAIS